MTTKNKETVLITGMHGMLAKDLSSVLTKTYHLRFLTRSKSKGNAYHWDIEKEIIDSNALVGVDHVIHLAGASIADGHWTATRKKEIISSRVDSALLIQKELKKQGLVLKSFISASAIGYYGSVTSNDIFKEDSPAGNDFVSEVCQKWESVAQSFEHKKLAKRTAFVRIGLILSNQGGVLDKLVPAVKLYTGSPFGNGKQFMNWVHIDDVSGIFKFVLDHPEMRGAYNAVAPEQVNNENFLTQLAEVLGKKVILPNIPKFVLKTMFGEMSVILTEGTKVSSEKVSQLGYKFAYKKLGTALKSLLLKS